MGRALTLGALALGSLFASTASLAEEREFSGKVVKLARAPGSQLAAQKAEHDVGDALKLGGDTLRIRQDGKKLFVASGPDGAPTLAVTAGGLTTLSLTGSQKVSLRFECDASGAWRYSAAEARQFEIAGTPLRIVDLDCDGRFTLADDGFSAYDAEMVCPLAPELTLGAWRVSIRSIAPDGSKLRAEVSPIEATPQQVETLVQLNLLRARNGLFPARLDPDASRACTAHAEYLRLSHWTGYTNPHSETDGAPGATEEGAKAARGSAIWRGSPAEATARFWRTYYHRIDLMQPSLVSIGVNATPKDISVVYAQDALGSYPQGDWPWVEPVTVPGDGTIGFPITSVSEEPAEPVADFRHRGGALMLLFRENSPDVKEFACRLVEVKGRREVPVPTLLAAQGTRTNVFGAVPEGPLNAKSQYRAVFTWSSAGARVTRTIDFRTE